MAANHNPTQSMIDAIPKELIDNIVQNLEGDITSLKNLRLSSKCLSHAATRSLYGSLLLYYSSESWAKVNLIARCPQLASCVRTLQLANLEGLPDLYEHEI